MVYRTDDPRYTDLEKVIKQLPYRQMGPGLLELLAAACTLRLSGDLGNERVADARATGIRENDPRTERPASPVMEQDEGSTAQKAAERGASPGYGRTASNFFNN